MFTYLKLKNFQSLADFEVDFMKNQKKPINLALIHGENGVGKTNLTNAYFMLQESFRAMKIYEIVRTIASEEVDNINLNGYVEKLKKHYPDTRIIEKKYKTFDTEGKMSLEFGFMFNNKNGRYIIEYNNSEIVYELLESSLLKENFYKFNSDCYGNKEIYPLTVYKERTITNFNLRKRYLSGLYGAVHYTKNINFYDVLNIDTEVIL